MSHLPKRTVVAEKTGRRLTEAGALLMTELFSGWIRGQIIGITRDLFIGFFLPAAPTKRMMAIIGHPMIGEPPFFLFLSMSLPPLLMDKH